MRSNPFWGYKLVFCEFLNLANVILQIYVTDTFLNGSFITLGVKFCYSNFDDEIDILDVMFPKMTKCNFYKYGPSGSIQQHDALCVMALNVINEKIFVFMWFWYAVLLVVTILALLWRLITVLFYSK